jgi:hypothetical protein
VEERDGNVEVIRPVTNDLRTGLQTALGNEYRVIDELGRGGMSRVF